MVPWLPRPTVPWLVVIVECALLPMLVAEALRWVGRWVYVCVCVGRGAISSIPSHPALAAEKTKDATLQDAAAGGRT